MDAGQYKHSALGLLDFHPVPRVPLPQRPMRTPPLRVSLIFCYNLLCSAAPTTMANPECPIIDLIDDGPSTTTIDTEAAATLPNSAASTPEAGQHLEPQNGSAVRTRSNSATPDRTAPCACARLILQVKDQNRVSNGQCATTSSTRLHGPSPHTLRPAFMSRLPQPMGTRVRGPTERAMPPARVPSAAATPHTAQQSEHAHTRDHGSTATTRAHRHPVLPPPFVDRPRQRRTGWSMAGTSRLSALSLGPCPPTIHQYMAPGMGLFEMQCHDQPTTWFFPKPPATPNMQPTWAENFRHRSAPPRWLGLHPFPQPCTAMPNSPHPHCFRGRSSKPAHPESQGSMCHFSWLGQGGWTQQQLKPGATIPSPPHIGEHWCKVYSKPPRSCGNTSSTS